MSDAFKITGPGFYKQRNGGKAEVCGVRGDDAVGFDAIGCPMLWSASGLRWVKGKADEDLIAPWSEPEQAHTPTPEHPSRGWQLPYRGVPVFTRLDGLESVTGERVFTAALITEGEWAEPGDKPA